MNDNKCSNKKKCYIMNDNKCSNKKKCYICKKKLGLTKQFICKCNKILCNYHRYYDMHECTINYKLKHKKNILENNPRVDSQKLVKI